MGRTQAGRFGPHPSGRVDPRSHSPKLRNRGETKFICPHTGGARSWLPTSYDPATKLIYIPLVESCGDLTPVAAGERANLTTGVRWTLRPRPDNDGRYGRLQAINIETKRVA